MAHDGVQLVVPGSTSNLGSGFDAISAALSVYLEIDVTFREDAGLIWPEGWTLEPAENAIEKGLRATAAELGVEVPGMAFEVRNDIPLRRGLGSSGAAYVAGIRLAEYLAGSRLPELESLAIAYGLEGHPENVAASLMGGWTLSWVDSGKVWSERLSSKLDCRFVVAIPDIEISTRQARAILPGQYGLEDAVFNLQRCGLLVFAISQGRPDLLGEATRDRLHQDYRASLIPGAEAVLAREGLPRHLDDQVLALTVSGSGSTLLAITTGEHDEVGRWMVEALAVRRSRADYHVLDLDTRGVRLVGEA